MCFLEVNESTGQRVVEGANIRRFEISSFRGFDFFDGGWGGGEKKVGRKRGGALPSYLGDLFEVIFFFFSSKWFPLF